METPCITSVLMASLTVGFIIADFYFNYGERILNYIFLGSIATILFYLLCSYGYQNVNWVFLAILPIYIIFALLSLYFRKVDISDPSDMCDSYEMEDCECTIPEPMPKINAECK